MLDNGSAAALDSGRASGHAVEAAKRSLEVVRQLEPRVRAWAYLDEGGAFARAERMDAGPAGPLTGLTVGIKDLVDTADMPTCYGSGIYEGHQPRADAEIVRLLTRAGALILGKTVATEFSLLTPGPTTNPWRETHTPGGSSSGSAAAVACGMVDVAIGTQTYGSLIKPASFCGAWAFKPSRGLVPVTGVKPLAPSYDQIGWFARSPALLDAVYRAVTGAAPVPDASSTPRVGILDVSGLAGLEPEITESLSQLRRAISARGGVVVDMDLHAPLDATRTAHHVAASHEISKSLRTEMERHHDRISEPLRRFVAGGAAVTQHQYEGALSQLQELECELFEALRTVDVLVTPSAPGEAPLGLESTGESSFCSPWTAIGSPTLNAPGFVGATGLPLGLQLVAPAGEDDAILAWARWLEEILPQPR